MHVDRHAELAGEPEYEVHVPLTRGQIDFVVGATADDVGPPAQRLPEHLQCAGRIQDPFLGEGHDLEVDQSAVLLAELQEHLDSEEADDRVDVGVRTDRRRAVADRLIEHPPDPGADGVPGEAPLELPGDRDRTGQGAVEVRLLLVQERLVEVQVRLDETGYHHAAIAVDRVVRPMGEVGRHRDDAALVYRDVYEGAAVLYPRPAKH